MDICNQITNTRYGIMLYNIHDIAVGKTLELYGEWSQSEMDFLAPYILQGGCCIDIGANIGTHTLFFANAVGPSGRVVAFEPQHVLFQILCANVALNQHLNIYSFNEAIYDSRCVFNFPKIDYRQPHNFGCFHSIQSEGRQVQANVLDHYGFHSVDLIKIDVEGTEPEVIVGATKTIRQHQPFIYSEYHPTEHSQNLIQLIQGFDYDVYLHHANSFNPNNFKKAATDILNGYRETNIFCAPRSKNLSLDLLMF